MNLRRTFSVALFCVACFSASQVDYVQSNYTKREVEVVMRDGVKLFTTIYAPKDSSKKAPLLMMRTPYSCRPYGTEMRANLGPEANFTKEGYIFVYQDVRGRYMSGGDFKWMTPFIPNKRAGQVDEATDTSDTIDWLLKNVANNNGRVGVYGTSFPGHYAAQCLIDPHPALKAASPQAPMVDNWLGDDMHHNGAFFLPHAMNFIAGFGKPRSGPTQDYGRGVFTHGTPDGYRFFLDMGPIKNALTKYNMNQIPLWKEWVKHGDYDEYWQTQNVSQHLKKADKVAILTVGGFFDAEDLYGPLDMYKAIERSTPNNDSKLIMGPWYHGSWNGGPGDALHDIKWATKTGEDFRDKYQKPFFRYYLWQDSAKPSIPDVTVFDVGADKWRTFESWPPKSGAMAFLMGGSGQLVKGPIIAEPIARGSIGDFIEWVSDPAKPVPVSTAISAGMPRQYMLEDQRFVWGRPDVVSFETPVQETDLTLAGPIKATLYVSTTGTDADFIVKLIDVFPNNAPNNSPRGSEIPMGGYQMMIRGEPMRAKYRNSWSKPTALTPGRVEKVEFVLPDICHTFKKGHKVMVQVQSSWFPLIDRNPQTFCNIFEADQSVFKKATHRLHLGGMSASRLEVSVLP
ncbi:MAG: CocE/NonD family hydrolase [Chlorobia bacterium]|nr:CocE/NonD family hydrolase [Fimbriimonadaceae bacterium]